MRVIFEIQGGSPVTMECNAGDNLLELARRGNVAIDAPCSGNGSCGKCRVQILEGVVESIPSRHISDEEYQAGWRLSCNCKVVSDCRVLVPDIASAYQSRMKTADLSSAEEVAIFTKAQQDMLDAGLSVGTDLVALELNLLPPSESDTMPDIERLQWAVREAAGVEIVELPFLVMAQMAAVCREQNWHITVKGRKNGDKFEILKLCKPENQQLLGCAIDIGTTTVTGVLTDLTTGEILSKGSGGNGQIRYGADVINRIIQQAKPGGKRTLQKAIVEETLVPLMLRLCRSAGVDSDDILRLCIGANTTMNHLLVGVDADPVRMDPYIPSFFSWEGLKAGDIGLPANPLAKVILSPNIGSYVGGDITAGTLASMLWDKDEMSLFIDLGTNGEIVFGNRDFFISCACSAGPAFEGGDISCGMRATDGAVEAVTIDPETQEPSLQVVGDAGQKPVGICGSGIIDVISQLFRCKIINAKGLFVGQGKRICRDEHGMGRFVLAFPEESETGREIAINEVDIDNFIRAKGAIFSAIDTLLQSVDMDISCIDKVYVAGGIGSGINMKNAVSIGMFPDVELEKFQYIGNSSLTGSYAMVISSLAEEKCHQLAANMTYLELSTYPGYMDSFVAACFLPHTDAKRFPSVL